MWRLLGGILAALFVAGVTAYVVKGIIDKRKLQQAMRDKEIREAMIETIDKYAHKVKLKDLKSGEHLEVQGEGVSSDIYEGQRIVA